MITINARAGVRDVYIIRADREAAEFRAKLPAQRKVCLRKQRKIKGPGRARRRLTIRQDVGTRGQHPARAAVNSCSRASSVRHPELLARRAMCSKESVYGQKGQRRR